MLVVEHTGNSEYPNADGNAAPIACAIPNTHADTTTQRRYADALDA